MKRFKTDWLASKSVFYNEKTCKISYNINDVIDYNNVNFHPEGLNNYLDFGFSVFGQTPIKNVKFLRHSSEIFKKNGRLEIVKYPDPVDKWFDDHPNYSDENKVLELIKSKIRNFEAKVTGLILIPTSGGFDSRLLNFFIKDKSRIRAFTYGVSPQQADSYEVVYAKKLCEKLNIKWDHIELSNFHKYLKNWDDLFGMSTHSHGMYHIEFYKKIYESIKYFGAFLSGAGGDWWSGLINFKEVKNYKKLYNVAYTHGLHSSSKFSKIKSEEKNIKSFYFNNKDKLLSWKYQNIIMARMKIILISYLVRLPESFGYKVWPPYFDMDLALNMLNLPPERRKNRQWQIDFFRKRDLYVEDEIKFPNQLNNLNHQAMEKVPLKPLNKKVLGHVIKEVYIENINKTLFDSSLIDKIVPMLYYLPFPPFISKKLIGSLKKIGINDQVLKSYCAYLTLKPIENVMLKAK